jgi:NADH-ubiquinone oxidoreductase chain 3
MTNLIFFFIFIPILALILLTISIILSPHNPYQKKNSAFGCGFHSFSGQNSVQLTISQFITVCFLFVVLEMLLICIRVINGYTPCIYVLTMLLVFFIILALSFVFILAEKDLGIDNKHIGNHKSKIII